MKLRRDNTEAELDALQSVAERLGGFAPGVNAEWLDGAFAALLSGPSVPDGPGGAIETLVGDAWARAFADPQDVAHATATLDTRWRVLRSQLDPDLLWEAPNTLQLSPLLLAPDTEAAYPLGIDWARGFVAVTQRPQFRWAQTRDPAMLEAMLSPIHALLLEDAALADWTAVHHRTPPTRQQLVDDACYAAQDLRLWWIEHAPRTAPRRAEALPGRNEPCFCGSGQKFKKCHGQART